MSEAKRSEMEAAFRAIFDEGQGLVAIGIVYWDNPRAVQGNYGIRRDMA
jgi:hypothetical protein